MSLFKDVFDVIATGWAGVGGRQPGVGRQKIITRHWYHLIVPETRQVEDDWTDKYRCDGDARSTDADEPARVEWLTHRHVATYGHDDSQPRARHQ